MMNKSIEEIVEFLIDKKLTITTAAVSYTHLDVYKRQVFSRSMY